MWLKTKIGKRVRIKSTQENTEWEGTLIDVDAIGFTINDVESGLMFIPFNNVFVVRVLEL
jgi:ribosome maturation factor RimP